MPNTLGTAKNHSGLKLSSRAKQRLNSWALPWEERDLAPNRATRTSSAFAFVVVVSPKQKTYPISPEFDQEHTNTARQSPGSRAGCSQAATSEGCTASLSTHATMSSGAGGSSAHRCPWYGIATAFTNLDVPAASMCQHSPGLTFSRGQALPPHAGELQFASGVNRSVFCSPCCSAELSRASFAARRPSGRLVLFSVHY